MAVPDVGISQMASLFEARWQLGSMVLLPIRAGSEILGVLSLGARCSYDYSQLELQAFQSIASGIGVALANYRSSQQLSGRVGEYTQAAVAIVAVEVARAARHEAVGLIDNCYYGLRKLKSTLDRGARKDSASDNAAEEIGAIEKDLKALSVVLDQIKTATRPPERVLQRVNLQELFSQARAAVAGRLQELRVSVKWSGPRDVVVDAYPDWLRQVFLNLLLNSIDAFGELRGSRVRRIEITVERPSERAGHYDLVHRDNATGINPARLQAPVNDAGTPVRQLIFEPGVTSKNAGSGYGLFLARRILDDHGGSIDLVDHRNGAAFRVRLPKPGGP